ncbi:hypothetical protein BDW22DRAFT_323735 [Trametopsis cervina]|nr:hypothetical protein BDW22DRAFT_323735 [Trametopsis cervina]
MSTPETFIGPLLIAICIAILLYGTFLAQVLFYWTTYSNDRAPIKIWVAILSVLETVHTIACVHMLYYYFAAHFGDTTIIEHVIWSAGVRLRLYPRLVFSDIFVIAQLSVNLVVCAERRCTRCSWHSSF